MARRTGFSLIELVVVVLILGILAAVAAPKVFNSSADAADRSAAVSLKALRDAIEQYTVTNNGAFPTDANAGQFTLAMKPLLRTPFPDCPVGGNPTKLTMSNDDPLVSDNKGGWMYNGDTGQIIINSTDISQDGVTPYDEF